MKCVSCGGTEFEKADIDGIFTLPYKSRHKIRVEVPRYFYACLGCGLVHQILDLEARKEGIKSLIEEELIRDLTHDRHGNVKGRVNVQDLAERTKLPLVLLKTTLDEYLKLHSGFEDGGRPRVVPVLEKDDGNLWIVGKKS